MSLTKKDLQTMITEAIKQTIIKEINPLIRKTIRQEFYKILKEAENHKGNRDAEDDLGMVRLLEQKEDEADDTREMVHRKIFNTGRFADILNQTAKQYPNRSISREIGDLNEQMEVVLNSKSLNPNTGIAFDPHKLASQLGYRDGFRKAGADINTPPAEKRTKVTARELVGESAERIPDQPVKVLLPTINPDGGRINLSNVPGKIIKNMMKDYSGLLKKTDQKVKRTRG